MANSQLLRGQLASFIVPKASDSSLVFAFCLVAALLIFCISLKSQNMPDEGRKLRRVFGSFISSSGEVSLEGEESPVISLEMFVLSQLQTWIRKPSLDDPVLLLFPQ